MKRALTTIAIATGAAALGALFVFGDANAVGGGWNFPIQQNFYCGPNANAGPGTMQGRRGHGMRGGYGPQGGYGPGMMQGGGYGPAMGYGPGQGFGPGTMLGMWADADRNGELTVDEVKAFFDTHAMPMNANVKLGEVTEKDADTLTVEMVTVDGSSTVRTFDIPRKVTAVAPNQGRGGYGFHRHGGPGMRGNYGPGMPGYGPMGFAPNAELTVDQVKARVQSSLTRWNSDTVQVGAVTETDKGTIVAEIVTKDGTVVRRMEYDKKTGRPVWTR